MTANELHAGRDSLISLVLRFQVLTASSMKMSAFWDIVPGNETTRRNVP
jgi:hypothetical protein